MAWFLYKDQPSRKMRVGICLRYRSLPKDLQKRIKKMIMIDESLIFIRVAELKPKNQVLLEVWTEPLFNSRHNDYIHYSVYVFCVDENPEWVCESDIGRGLVLKKR
jgi:hypothetical protein